MYFVASVFLYKNALVMKMFIMKMMMEMMLIPTHLKFWIWIPLVVMAFYFFSFNVVNAVFSTTHIEISILSLLSPIILGLLISGLMYLIFNRKYFSPQLSTAHLMVVIMPLMALIGFLKYDYFIGVQPQNLSWFTWLYYMSVLSFLIGYVIYFFNFKTAQQNLKEFG